jgi:hypothetical protein
MPLGILLAAAWSGVLSPAEIADEVERSIDFLAGDLRDIPADGAEGAVAERHRSIRAVLDRSWDLLSPREREMSLALSVLSGGFTREAAEQIADASLPDLMALSDKSLVYGTGEGRYGMHELLRRYAAEKRDLLPAIAQRIYERVGAYYGRMMRRWTAADALLASDKERRHLRDEMDAEGENARTA